jgi:hypothetical protein
VALATLGHNDAASMGALLLAASPRCSFKQYRGRPRPMGDAANIAVKREVERVMRKERRDERVKREEDERVKREDEPPQLN